MNHHLSKHPALRGLTAIVVACIALTLVAPRLASAHAELRSTSPAANSILPTSPSLISLTFSEAIDTVPDAIRLFAADGKQVDIGDVDQDQGIETIEATVPTLADGTYVVSWQVVSSDSHPISGAYTFSVGAPTETAPGLVTGLLEGSKPNDGTEVWLGVGRWASFIGVGVLLGAFAVLAICAPDVLRSRRAGVVLAAGVAVGVLGTMLMVVAQAGITVGGAFTPGSWRAVYRTRAGGWWVIRLVLLIAGAAAIPVRRRFSARGLWPTIVLLYAVALLAVTAAGGHGISGRLVAVGFIATCIHLAAMSTWLGGLAALGIAVPRSELRHAAARFSPIALGSVVLLSLTGVTNGWRQAGWSLGDLVDSTYGRWLVVKLVLIAAVVAIAAASRWLVRSAPIGEPDGETIGDADADVSRPLRRTVLAEVVGMAIVLGATAGLVNSPPPRELRIAPVSVSVVVGDRIAQVDLDPPVTGGTTMHVYVRSAGGSLSQPTELSVTASLPASGIDKLALPLELAGPDHLTSESVDLPIAGTWTFIVTARYGEFDEVTFTLQIDVR